MPRYRLKLHKHAVKFLRGLPVRIRQRVREKLDTLVADPFDSGSLDVKPMAGEDGLWPMRVGSIRIIHEVQDDLLLIDVLSAGRRGDVYRKHRPYAMPPISPLFNASAMSLITSS